MKPILKIAKNELRNLFYSPVAWFLAIAFMVMCAYFYTSILYPQAKSFFMVLNNNPSWVYMATDSATKLIFNSFFGSVLANIYLFIPLLTMGIINREFNNGAIRLLYSSPVTLHQIVLGKYLALMIYNLVFVFVVGIFIVSGLFDIRSLDYAPLLSATLGIYLFLCALTAIGFFMSGLTAYPIVAAIASFTVLFILMVVGGLWQQYDFVRDLTWFLSVRNRTERMIAGLIRSKDVLYYLVIIYLFVSFTLLKLRSGRETKPWYIQTARYLAIALSGLTIGYLSSLPRFSHYWDVTARKTNTLHPRTRETLRKLRDSTVEVTIYTNLLDGSSDGRIGLPSGHNSYLDMWEPYVRCKPDIRFRYEYYYAVAPGDSGYYKLFPGKTLRQIAGLMAKGLQVDPALFKSPEEIRRQIDLAPENYATVIQLKCGNRTAFVRYLPSETGISFEEGSTEPAISAALRRIAGDTMPKIAFVSGELERNIYKRGEREYWLHALGKVGFNDFRVYGSLINLGFDADTLNLAMQDIPEDITTLVLSDPKMDMSPVVLYKLRAYVNKGGNMLVMGEPGKQYVLNPFLRQLGIRLENGQLVQPSSNETPDKIRGYATTTGLGLAEEFWMLRYKSWWEHKIYSDSFQVAMLGATTLSPTGDSGFAIQTLSLTTPDRTWLKAGRLVADSAAPVFSPGEGDIKERSFPTIMQLTRQRGAREQRIAVSGDADIASSIKVNTNLVRSLYSWLNYNQFPVYITFPPARDNIVVLQPGWAAGQKIVYIWVLPGILMVTGIILLVRRQRK